MAAPIKPHRHHWAHRGSESLLDFLEPQAISHIYQFSSPNFFFFLITCYCIVNSIMKREIQTGLWSDIDYYAIRLIYFLCQTKKAITDLHGSFFGFWHIVLHDMCVYHILKGYLDDKTHEAHMNLLLQPREKLWENRDPNQQIASYCPCCN